MSQNTTPDKLLLVRVQDDLHGARHDGKTLTLGYDKTTGSDRNTLHFTVNSIVPDTPYGKFTSDSAGELKGKIVIVANPKDMPVPAGWGQVDSWWRLHGERDAQGKLHRGLPVGDATIIAPVGTEVPKGAMAVFYDGGVEARDAAVRQVVEQLGAELRPASFWGWSGHGQLHEDWRRETAAQLWPGQEKHIHLGPHDGSLDNELENATLHGQLQAMKDYGRLHEQSSGMQEPWVDVMARTVEKARTDMHKLMTEVAPPQERPLIQEHYRDQLQRLENHLAQANKLDKEMQPPAPVPQHAEVPPPLPQEPQTSPPLPQAAQVSPSSSQPVRKDVPQMSTAPTDNRDNDFKPYAVIASNSPTQRFADVEEAARAFANIPVDRLPKVELRQRGTIEIGGQTKPKVTTTLIAATRMEGNLPVRRFTKVAPQDFRDAVEAARNQALERQSPGQEAAPTQALAPTAPLAAAAPTAHSVPPTAPQQERTSAQLPQVDRQQITRLTFTKSQTPRGLEFKVRAYGAGKLPLVEYEGLTKEALAQHFGEHVADAAEASKNRTGTMQQHELATPGQVPAQQESPMAPAPASSQADEQAAQQTMQRAAANTIDAVLHPDQERRPAPEKEPLPAGPQARPVAPQAPEDSKGDRSQQLFESLAERFEIARAGSLFRTEDEYRIKGNGPLRIAFTDHGKRLSSAYDTKEVVQGMADLAQAKGWREITAAGTPEFRRSIWMEGNLRGIHVNGFVPSPQDHERLRAARAQLGQQQSEPAKQENTVELDRQRHPAKPPAGQHEQPPKAAAADKAKQPAAQHEQPQKAAASDKAMKPEKAQPASAAAAKQPAQGTQASDQQPTTSREQWLTSMRTVLQDQGVDKATIDRAVDRMGLKVDAMLAAGQKLPPIHVVDRKAPSVAATPQPVALPLHQPSRGHEMPAPGQ